MKNDKDKKKVQVIRTLSTRIMDLAYIRDGDVTHTDEAVILACLLHSKGKGRGTADHKEVQRIMKDRNLEPEDVEQLNRKRD
jgi:hypothetical protein